MIDPGSRGLFKSDQDIHIIIANEGRITTMHPAHLIGLTFKRFHVPTFKRPLIPTILRSNLLFLQPSTLELILKKEIQKNEGGTNITPPFSPLFCRK